ncbi:hypothetical protein IT568_09520 [bacterium]|nr:hypothetical protein [bacterium]
MKTKETVNFRQVLTYVKQLPDKDKDKLSIFLRNEKLKNFLTTLRKTTKNIPLTFEEITSEVEETRKQRYEKQNCN